MSENMKSASCTQDVSALLKQRMRNYGGISSENFKHVLMQDPQLLADMISSLIQKKVTCVIPLDCDLADDVLVVVFYVEGSRRPYCAKMGLEQIRNNHTLLS